MTSSSDTCYPCSTTRIKMRQPWTDDGLRHLVKLKQLRDLSVWGTNVSDAGVKHLVKLKQLRSLGIPDACYTDRALRAFRKANLLHTLNLVWGKKWNDPPRAEDITHAVLCSTPITDAGLAELAGLP